MAETLEQITTRLKAEYPTLYGSANGERYELPPKEYEEEIARWAANEREQHLADEAEATRKDARRQIRAGLTALNADIATLAGTSGLTVAQMRPMLLRTNRALVGLVAILIDLNLIEREG